MNKRRIGALFAAGAAMCGSAHAQHAGDNVIQLGYGHIQTLDNSQPLHTDLYVDGAQIPFDSPGTSSKIGNSNTPFLSFLHFFTDHIAVATAGGIPAHFKLFGSGTIAPVGLPGTPSVNLGEADNNPLATVKQWTPALFAQYYFGAADAEIRPFIGAGMSYTWFSAVRVNENFQQQSEDRFGTLLDAANLKAGPSHVVAYASSSFQPVFTIGVQQRITGRLSLIANATYDMLHTKADIKIESANGSVLSDSTTRININPLALTVFLGYDFGPGIPFLH